MAAVQTRARFDPEAHLHKQGWKGKGTAFKQGHLTRPLAVVRKKTLSGIGKDRDEAIPFWDNIFAATAASIFSTSTPSSSVASPAITRTGTPTVTPVPETTSYVALSTAARVSRETARRGLYSRFFRGKVLTLEEEEVERTGSQEQEPAAETAAAGAGNAEAGPSKSTTSAANKASSLSAEGMVKSSKSKGKVREGETKDERRARRAEKALRKVDKEERRAMRAEKKALKEGGDVAGDVGDSSEEAGKKRKRRKDQPETMDPGVISLADGAEDKAKRKKGKKRDDAQ